MRMFIVYDMTKGIIEDNVFPFPQKYNPERLDLDTNYHQRMIERNNKLKMEVC